MTGTGGLPLGPGTPILPGLADPARNPDPDRWQTTGGWAATVRKYSAIVGTAVRHRLAYFGDTLGRPFFFATILFVFCQLWQKVFADGRGPVAGFGARETLWYLVLTEAILLSTPRLQGRIDEEVKTGAVATLMNKPCHYVWYHLAFAFGETIPVFFLNLGVGIAVAWFLIGPLPIPAAAVLALFPAVAMAVTLYILISLSLALLAFWVEDAAPFFWIFHKLMFILGGLMIPLDFLPDWLRQIADWLPFRTILCGPARLFVQYSSGEAGALLLWQVAWIAFFALVAGTLYRIGITKVQFHGG